MIHLAIEVVNSKYVTRCGRAFDVTGKLFESGEWSAIWTPSGLAALALHHSNEVCPDCLADEEVQMALLKQVIL